MVIKVFKKIKIINGFIFIISFYFIFNWRKISLKVFGKVDFEILLQSFDNSGLCFA